MNKTIMVDLNRFPIIPNGLRVDPTQNKCKTEISLDLSRLYHHYYLDSYGISAPSVNHAEFEYLHFLDNCQDYRFLNDGPGESTAKKRGISAELGQAFFRYFLYEYLGITYFAHMNKILDKQIHPAFNGLQIKRANKGDVPDYLCAKSVNKIYIGEAKGRYSHISFDSNEFENWRKQFNRIEVRDNQNVLRKIKGYIIATHYATQRNLKDKSVLNAEDPYTKGDLDLNENVGGIGGIVLAIHYSRILSKLGLYIFSESLASGFTIPSDLTYRLPVWRCNYGPIAGERFIGGYISEFEQLFIKNQSGRHQFQPNILRLGNYRNIFIGLKLDMMRLIRRICLGNWNLFQEWPELIDTNSRPSNLAWLRDGSISGSLDFFEYEGLEQI